MLELQLKLIDILNSKETRIIEVDFKRNERFNKNVPAVGDGRPKGTVTNIDHSWGEPRRCISHNDKLKLKQLSADSDA